MNDHIRWIRCSRRMGRMEERELPGEDRLRAGLGAAVPLRQPHLLRQEGLRHSGELALINVSL